MALIKCKECGTEVSKSATACPKCGAPIKKKTSLFTWFVTIVVVLIVIAMVNQPSKEQREQRDNAQLEQLAEAPVSDISPHGELAEIFAFGSKYTDIQRENKEKEITGKVIQWKLKVYEVKKSSEDIYIIQTASDSDTVGTLADISVRNAQEKSSIESLKTGDFVTVKGKIDGVSALRHITIDPAVLVK
jgi:RNA polymerase subunit RPABC4/transcription elongation factor Spt4